MDDACGREIDTGMPRVYQLRKQVSAWNVDGSAKDHPSRPLLSQVAPSPHEFAPKLSWLHFWKHLTGQNPSECSYVDCRGIAAHGGHIWISGKGGKEKEYCYIAPICKRCNYHYNTDRHQSGKSTLEKDTYVVRNTYERRYEKCTKKIVGLYES